tara:strand:+ start:296 stop:553 length:258 start_codon:yes stop_codon:yes gene_type:complete
MVMEQDIEAYNTINNYIMYVYNVNYHELIFTIFGEEYDDMQYHRQKYVDGKINRNSPAQMWVSLDTDKQNRLIKASREYYGRDRK